MKLYEIYSSTKMWPCWCTLFSLFLSLSVQNGSRLNISNKCNTALGFEDLRIRDSQLSALSYYERFPNGDGKEFEAHPRCARLNNHDCAWCAPHGNRQYLQVDLGSDFVITGIATQGFQTMNSDYFVKEYKVAYSKDGKIWKFLPVMRGNGDSISEVRHTLSSPRARYIRVYPMAYSNRICMRIELYGCSNSSSALSTTLPPITLSGANNTTPENLSSATRTTAASSAEKPMISNSTTAPSALSTTPSPTTQSVTNNTTPENVLPTARTAAASSTEKPVIIPSPAASSVLSTRPSPTTLSGANNTTSENVPLITRTTAASSTEKPIDYPVASGKVSITTLIIAIVLVVITLVRVVFMVVCTIYCQKGTRSRRGEPLL